MLSNSMAEIRTAALMCTSCLGGRFVCVHVRMCACMPACGWASVQACVRSQAQPSAAVRSRAQPCVRACVPTSVRVRVRTRVCVCASACVPVRACLCLASVSVSVCLCLCVCLSPWYHQLQEMLCLRNGDFQPLGVSEFPCRCLQKLESESFNFMLFPLLHCLQTGVPQECRKKCGSPVPYSRALRILGFWRENKNIALGMA